MHYHPPVTPFRTRTNRAEAIPPIELFGDARVGTANALLCAASDPDEAPNADVGAGRGRSNRSADLLLRLAGLALIGIAAATGHLLMMRVNGGAHHDGTLPEYLLALLGITSACAGSMLLCLGRHAFDRVIVSERWRRRL